MPEVAAFSSAWADPDLRVAQWQGSREWRSVLGHLGAFSAFEAMTKAILVAAIALLLTCASVVMHPATDERAMYGFEGPLEQNWLPREVAGWPAPFLADSTATSVPHQIGPEDHFRHGPFVADLGFWALVVLGVMRVWRLLRRRA